jgi:hypothetical protein
MNNEQLKLQINFLTERLKFYQSLMVLIAGGIITVIISKDYLGTILYFLLPGSGVTFIIILIKELLRIDKRIQTLINQVV